MRRLKGVRKLILMEESLKEGMAVSLKNGAKVFEKPLL
jgi:hypothetical protein